MKNVLIIILGLAVVAEGLYIAKKQFMKPAVNPVTNSSGQTSGPAKTPPPILTKGAKFSDSPIFKNAYQIAPGDLNDAAKKAMVGFVIDRQTMTNGSMVVKLTPTDSDDQSQEYTVKKGETLYFVEMTLNDDKEAENKDLNLRDDYGVIVDASGLVQ